MTEELVLSRCRAASLDTIKHINCWGMALTDISIVQYMTNLEVATFSVNKINSLKYLSYCPKLSELYIRKNELQSVEDLKCLQQLPNLRILWIADNPLCTDNYRQLVLELLPCLVKLDNIAVTPNLNSKALTEQRRKKKSQRPKSAASVDSSFSDAESIIRKSVETPIINAITALLPSLDVEGLYVVRGVIDKKIRNAERSEQDSVSAS